MEYTEWASKRSAVQKAFSDFSALVGEDLGRQADKIAWLEAQLKTGDKALARAKAEGLEWAAWQMRKFISKVSKNTAVYQHGKVWAGNFHREAQAVRKEG